MKNVIFIFFALFFLSPATMWGQDCSKVLNLQFDMPSGEQFGMLDHLGKAIPHTDIVQKDEILQWLQTEVFQHIIVNSNKCPVDGRVTLRHIYDVTFEPLTEERDYKIVKGINMAAGVSDMLSRFFWRSNTFDTIDRSIQEAQYYTRDIPKKKVIIGSKETVTLRIEAIAEIKDSKGSLIKWNPGSFSQSINFSIYRNLQNQAFKLEGDMEDIAKDARWKGVSFDIPNLNLASRRIAIMYAINMKNKVFYTGKGE